MDFGIFSKKRTRAKQGRGIHLQQKIGFQSGKDIVLKSKTSCFTVSDSSDRCAISITRLNYLIANEL